MIISIIHIIMSTWLLKFVTRCMNNPIMSNYTHSKFSTLNIGNIIMAVLQSAVAH